VRKAIFVILFFISGFSAMSLENTNDRYYFPGLFDMPLMTLPEAERVVKSNTTDIQSLINSGLFYFAQGNVLEKNDKRKEEYLFNAITIFEKLWNTDKRNNKYRLLLGYSYTSICNTNISIEDILKYVFRARNMFTMVIADLPDNIDARLARNRVNMNIPKNAGRPDDMIIEDSLRFFATYDVLDTEQKNSLYLISGIQEMRLAAVIIYEDRKQKEEAARLWRQIDARYLEKFYMDLYQSYAAKLGV
jgi:hypothetical protein